MQITSGWAGCRALAMAALILPWAASGCGEKMQDNETRGGTRVDGAAPVSNQPHLGASDDVAGLKKEGDTKGGPGADASTPYGGGGAGVAPPVTPIEGAQPSGDTNSGQTSGAKEGPGVDAGTDASKASPNASGPGTGTPPK